MTTHRLFTTSRSGEHHHLIPADLLTDAVARARAAHHERTGDDPNLIYVANRDTLHPKWTPSLTVYEQDKAALR